MYLIYRPPSAQAESISELATVVREAGKNSILFGDFNLPDIEWELGTARGRAAELLEAVQDNMMEQLVDFPTHIKENMLDLLLTNIPDRVEEVTDAGRLGKSDHVIIVTKIEVGRDSEEEKEPLPDWRRADWDTMRDELSNINWRARLERKKTSDAWRTFVGTVTRLVEKHVPPRRRRNPNRPAWMTREILRAVRKKKRLWKVVRNNRITEEYKQVEKEVKNMIRKAKRKFKKKLADGNEGNKRPFFAYVKQRTKSRQTIGPLKNPDGSTVDTVKMADLLNDTFKGVFTREDPDNIPEPEARRYRNEVKTVEFSLHQVKKKIAELRTDAAAGPDGIGPKLLKELANQLAPALVMIFRKSMKEGTVLEDWREANVTPIFKKGKKSCPGDFRPVSLTSICCKLMESVVRDTLTTHLTNNNLIGPSQHGYMKGRSCATNLLQFLERATTAVDRGEAFDIIYLDFAKAFDKVPHKRLMRKLRAHGVTGHLLEWVKSWLANHRQRVVLNRKFSSWADVLSGVPQGSVLGPLLFVIFINDIDEAVTLVDIIKKFADDTKIGQRIVTEQDKKDMQQALDNLSRWAEKWGMEFNVLKCKVMHLGHNNPQHDYLMDGQSLEHTTEEKDIGVTVSNTQHSVPEQPEPPSRYLAK